MQGQYLSKEEIYNQIPEYPISINDIISSDSYHEDKLLKKYLSYNKNDQLLIFRCAIQLGVIGYGNKNYGFVRDENNEVVSLVDLFKRYDIKYNEKLNAKYNDDDLSVRRLLRLFRYQISRFIIENNRPSFLWLKYANKENTDYMKLCFPGGEHIVETIEEAEFMIETYKNLDILMNTQFRSRLKRVFIARGIMNPEYFINKDY